MKPGHAGALACLAVVAASNGWVLLQAAWNRWGEPEAQVVLTERELRRVSGNPADLNSHFLRLEWQEGDSWPEALPWFGPEKVRELVFVVPRHSRDEWLRPRYYGTVPLHEAFAVLELGGETWQSYLASREKKLRDPATGVRQWKSEIEELRRRGSRLVAVDVGLDPEELRRHYPDRSRFLILPAAVGAHPLPEARGGFMAGYISNLKIQEIYMPWPVEQALYRAPWDSKNWEYRYQVVLAVGRRYEPWLVRLTGRPREAEE